MVMIRMMKKQDYNNHFYSDDQNYIHTMMRKIKMTILFMVEEIGTHNKSNSQSKPTLNPKDSFGKPSSCSFCY